MSKEIRVYFCPECKSTDVKYTFGLRNLFGVIPIQECGSCKTRSGTFPILVTTEEILLEREAEKKDRISRKQTKKSVKKKSSKKEVSKKSVKKVKKKGARK